MPPPDPAVPFVCVLEGYGQFLNGVAISGGLGQSPPRVTHHTLINAADLVLVACNQSHALARRLILNLQLATRSVARPASFDMVHP